MSILSGLQAPTIPQKYGFFLLHSLALSFLFLCPPGPLCFFYPWLDFAPLVCGCHPLPFQPRSAPSSHSPFSTCSRSCFLGREKLSPCPSQGTISYALLILTENAQIQAPTKAALKLCLISSFDSCFTQCLLLLFSPSLISLASVPSRSCAF